MASLKTLFKKSRVIAPLHTNGPVALTHDGSRLFTCVGEQILLTHVETGRELCRLKGDSTPITSMVVSPSSTHLAVFYTSATLRIYAIPPLLHLIESADDESRENAPTIQPIRVVSKCHEAPVHVCRIDPSSTLLASGSADGVVKVWDIQRGYVTHMFKGHGGVVSALAFNHPKETASSSSTTAPKDLLQLITASADTRLRIFDLSNSATRTAGAKPQAVLEGHVSVPRGLDVSPDGRWLISGGRDSVVLVWDLATPTTEDVSAKTKDKGKGKSKATDTFKPILFKTIPVSERVEAVGLISAKESIASSSSSEVIPPNGRLKFYTGGEKGFMRVWDAWEGKVLASYGDDILETSQEVEEPREILDVLYTPSTSTLTSIHADQNLMSYSLRTGSLVRQHIGFNDEIIDARLLSPLRSVPDSHIALATNSSLIRIYDTATFDARLLSGHSDMVLCLDAGSNGSLLASGSKDKSARIWRPISRSHISQQEPDSASPQNAHDWRCVAVAEGHAESIGALALSRRSDCQFMFTGSQDRTVKMWDLGVLTQSTSDGAEAEGVRLKSLSTLKAHDKDINSLDVSFNDRLLATASQDKTINVYEIDYAPALVSRSRPARGEIKLVGTCKGHKRGVWNVRFSRTERFIASASGDKTIKMWNLDDFSCIKTFEGHTNTVLRVDFISQGMQLVSSASDGLVKLWNVKDEECVTSLDNHEDKIWALTVSSDEKTIISGAADSVVTFWTDHTQEQLIEKENKRAELVLKEQDFQNYIALRDYRAAILLALSMNQPGRLLSLFTSIRAAAVSSDSVSLSDATSITGSASVDEIIRTLPHLELARLLVHVRDWNASAKTSSVAQTVLHAILKFRTANDISKAFEAPSTTMMMTSDDGNDDEEAEENDEGEQRRKKNKAKPPVGLKELVDALLPYTERHLARADKLVQDSFVVDYILGEMDMGLLPDESMMDVDIAA